MLYSIGPDDPGYTVRNAIWTVAWYQEGDWSGSGEAVSLVEGGMLEIRDLSHCSCYGPFDEPPTATVSVADFLTDVNNIHCDCSHPEVERKVRELLTGEAAT